MTTMKTYNEPYEADESARNFFIVLDVLKMFVDPSTNEIFEPSVCATLLCQIEPIVRRAAVFSEYLSPAFDPNDIVNCLVNVVYPEFLSNNGIEQPKRPRVERIEAQDELPKDFYRYDAIYRQILAWLYARHEDENLNMVDMESLKNDMRIFLPMIHAISVLDSEFGHCTDEELIEVLVNLRLRDEPILRNISNGYEVES